MKVNGENIMLSSPKTVSELIKEMGYREDRIAVIINGQMTPKWNYDNIQLNDEDNVEIVGFVGGG